MQTFITTYPRPSGRDLLSETIRSLVAAGWDSSEIEVISLKGVYRCWRMALSLYGSDLISIVQDDIIVRPGLHDYLLRTVGEDGVYSPYTARTHGDTGLTGWHPYMGRGWLLCGACFLVMRPAVARWLDARLPTETESGKNIDSYVGLVLKNTKYSLFHHHPSLVEHVADADSTCGYSSSPLVRTAHGFINERI